MQGPVLSRQPLPPGPCGPLIREKPRRRLSLRAPSVALLPEVIHLPIDAGLHPLQRLTRGIKGRQLDGRLGCPGCLDGSPLLTFIQFADAEHRDGDRNDQEADGEENCRASICPAAEAECAVHGEEVGGRAGGHAAFPAFDGD